MPRNTGAPKLTPARPVQALRKMTDSELHEVINDTDYSAHYRGLAEDEQRLRRLERD